MGLPQLDWCCCGCTIKTGTKILLWLNLVSCVGNIFILIGETSAKELGQVPSPPDQTTDIATIWAIIDYIIWFVICTIALCGVEKELHSCLVPYLIWMWIDFIITPFLSPPLLRDNIVLAMVIGFFLGGYFWLVVYSHYRNLKEPPIDLSAV